MHREDHQHRQARVISSITIPEQAVTLVREDRAVLQRQAQVLRKQIQAAVVPTHRAAVLREQALRQITTASAT